ncbi:uncharacterized protein VDAG_05628 [Verticillium dahliae VdLs.17]|uniref:Phosphoglycerate mutase family protein n=2 Tax=Verticillium dahliae TaxID=27337 RepID=G2X5X3_VERDV|nr:uncharacterized protein VDAG_05628 [Verticillium dahliae VdLs.17]EGY14464.1 hypothetical protein VDAG_05628 [Verticillium dahliae VdLs.17]KAH6698691.1 histidine phosphatase superfamily [Verticillium dahliae]
MPNTIVLIRHAQALHNVDKNYTIPDPPLSTLGLAQCQELRSSLLETFGDVQDAAIIASPMIRTMQTALLSLDWLVDKGVQIRADATWQENSIKPCDTGSTIDTLVERFPTIDFSTMDPVYPDKTSDGAASYAYTRRAILARAETGLRNLQARPEKIVFVVSHSGFLRAGLTGFSFFNGDFRVFELVAAAEPRQLPQLRQWAATIRGGLGKSCVDVVELGHHLPDDEIRTATSN